MSKRPRLEHLQPELKVLSQKTATIKQNLLFSVDAWGQRFPVRLCASSLCFLTAEEAAIAYGACKSWKASRGYMGPFWREKYTRDWELETAQDKRIANEGPDTPWDKRYKRRKQTELNLRAGKYRVLCHGGPREAALPSRIFDVHDNARTIWVSTTPFYTNVTKGNFSYHRTPTADLTTVRVAYGRMILSDSDLYLTCLNANDLSLNFHRKMSFRSDRVQITRSNVLSASRFAGIEARDPTTGELKWSIDWEMTLKSDFQLTAFVYDEDADVLYACGLEDIRTSSVLAAVYWASNAAKRLVRKIHHHDLKLFQKFWFNDTLLLAKNPKELILLCDFNAYVFDLLSLQPISSSATEDLRVAAFYHSLVTRTTILATSYNGTSILDRHSLQLLHRVDPWRFSNVVGSSSLEIFVRAGDNVLLLDFTPL